MKTPPDGFGQTKAAERGSPEPQRPRFFERVRTCWTRSAFVRAVRLETRAPWTSSMAAKISRAISELGLTVPLAALLIASTVGVGLLGVRLALGGDWRQLYLVANLILAWLPLIFAAIACRISRCGSVRNWRFFASTGAWLVFFPNAP